MHALNPLHSLAHGRLSQAFPRLTSLTISSSTMPCHYPRTSRLQGKLGSTHRARRLPDDMPHGKHTMQHIGNELRCLSGLTSLRLEHVKLSATDFLDLVTHAGFSGPEWLAPRAGLVPIPAATGHVIHRWMGPGSVFALSQLQMLSLRSSGLDDAGMEPIAGMVNRLPQLTHLDLSYNRIGVSGARDLGLALASVSGHRTASGCTQASLGKLQILNLHDSLQRGACVPALAHALSRLVSLKLLHISVKEGWSADEQHACAVALQRLLAGNSRLSIVS